MAPVDRRARRGDWIERFWMLVNTLAVLYVLFVVVPEQAHKIAKTAAAAHTTAVAAKETADATRALAAANRANELVTRAALCAFWGDLGKRIKQTKDYLAKNPQPLVLGVPRATFEKSLADQQRTYRTLAGLRCLM